MGKQVNEISFRDVYKVWLGKIDTMTPFAFLEAFLSDITTYSERIEQVKKWQKDAIDIIENDYYLNEWHDDFASYIRFCERLRELKEEEISVIKDESSRSFHRKEITLLMEYITPQEMIAFTSLFDRINDFYSVRRSPKYLLTYYSLIYRENSIASIGSLNLLDFAMRFTAMEMLRTYLLIEHDINDILKIEPVSKSIRTKCLEIYLKERIRCLREKNSEEDDTRPYPLSDLECMHIIYSQDIAFVTALTFIRNDKELNDKLLDDSCHSEQLYAEMQNYRLKVEQFKKAYGLSYKVVPAEELIPIGDDLIEHMHKLMQCYIRLLEENMKENTNDAIPNNVTINIANGDYVAGDKYVGAQSEPLQKVTTTFTPKDKRGPKYQVLFADKNGDEDSKRTHTEKERLLRYLRDYDLMSQKLSSSKHDELTKVIICFCKKWIELRYAPTSLSTTALARFLVEACGIDKKVNQVSIANVLKPLLKSGEYDRQIYDQVCAYF